MAVKTSKFDVEIVSFILSCIKTIKEKQAKEGHFGCICGGTVIFSVAPNGHSRGRCDNKKCKVEWIE